MLTVLSIGMFPLEFLAKSLDGKQDLVVPTADEIATLASLNHIHYQ